jgi:hypothetical protein
MNGAGKMTDYRELIREIEEGVAETKETTAAMTDHEFVAGAAVVLEELIGLREEYNYCMAMWKVWYAEAARRNLHHDILEKMENEGR